MDVFLLFKGHQEGGGLLLLMLMMNASSRIEVHPIGGANVGDDKLSRDFVRIRCCMDPIPISKHANMHVGI
jgi:hypothetical protein